MCITESFFTFLSHRLKTNETKSKRRSHLSRHAVMTLPESLTSCLRGVVPSHLWLPRWDASIEGESHKPATIKLIQVKLGCLFVCTLGPSPDKLIKAQNITCCPICSDPVLSWCPVRCKITNLWNVKMDWNRSLWDTHNWWSFSNTMELFSTSQCPWSASW